MPTAAPYIPAKDSAYDNWLNNFQTVIAADPSAYGLSSTDASTITAAYTAWHAAYLLVTSPSTKTSSTVAAKNTQRASSLITARTYAQIIQNNAGVTDENKAAAGLTVRATGRTPIPTPTNVPILGLIVQTTGVAQINYKNSANPTSKQKPYGSIQVQYAWSIAPTAPDPDANDGTGIATKAPFLFTTPVGAVGKTIYLWARFMTRRGLVGPWSTAITLTGT